MGTGRLKYTEEYKAAAVERLYEPGSTLGRVAKEPGLTPTQLKMWRLETEAELLSILVYELLLKL